MSEIRFCVHCGKEMLPGDTFCPLCGSGQDSKVRRGVGESRSERKKNTDRTSLAAALAFINGIILIYGSIDLLSGMLGVIVVAAAALSIVSAVLIFLRRMWIVAVILCLAPIVSIFGLILSVIVVFLLLRAKPVFRNRSMMHT